MQEKKASYICKNLSKPKADQPWGWGENKQVMAEQKLEGGQEFKVSLGYPERLFLKTGNLNTSHPLLTHCSLSFQLLGRAEHVVTMLLALHGRHLPTLVAWDVEWLPVIFEDCG